MEPGPMVGNRLVTSPGMRLFPAAPLAGLGSASPGIVGVGGAAQAPNTARRVGQLKSERDFLAERSGL